MSLQRYPADPLHGHSDGIREVSVVDGLNHEELERRLRLNEAELDEYGNSNGDLGVGETIIFIATLVGVVLVALLWRQM